MRMSASVLKWSLCGKPSFYYLGFFLWAKCVSCMPPLCSHGQHFIWCPFLNHLLVKAMELAWMPLTEKQSHSGDSLGFFRRMRLLWRRWVKPGYVNKEDGERDGCSLTAGSSSCNPKYLSDILMLSTVQGTPDKRCLEMPASFSAYRKSIQEKYRAAFHCMCQAVCRSNMGWKLSLLHMSCIQSGLVGLGWWLHCSDCQHVQMAPKTSVKSPLCADVFWSSLGQPAS